MGVTATCSQNDGNATLTDDSTGTTLPVRPLLSFLDSPSATYVVYLAAPELARLLEYCPAHNTLFPGSLPWD